jgi:hypothetical protein
MWRSFGVGMSEAIDLAKTEPEPPKAAKRKQACYAQWDVFLSCFLFFLKYSIYFRSLIQGFLKYFYEYVFLYHFSYQQRQVALI